MSLKVLARERLAIIGGAETAGETCFIHPPLPKEPVKHPNPQKTAENGSCFTVSSPRARNSETRRWGEQIERGLSLLQGMSPPRARDLSAWEQVRIDALRLSTEGWVKKALTLGWEPLHLFGCSPDIGGNPDHEGLAVALAGRRLLLLDTASAMIVSEPGAHVFFNVRPMSGAVLLWELA